MYSKVMSGIVKGIEGVLVRVEADISNGLPGFEMVGYLSSALKESRERVKTALKNEGYQIPSKKITVNLLPADLRKDGSGFDLPIAVAILISSGYILQERAEKVFFAGELGLDARIHGVRGILPLVLCAKEAGMKLCILPEENVEEANLIDEVAILGVTSLKEVEAHLNKKIQVTRKREKREFEEKQSIELDFSDIIGQEFAKRAIEVAVAGRHNLLFFGPPGSGKSMLAKRIPYIAPNLTKKESLELTKIYSVKGCLKQKRELISKRPFRSPHHSITIPALIGGGRPVTPGEISLAHNGILFLDELLEFPKNTLETMRQPLEERKVLVARLEEQYEFPADLMLVAATNLCPCGYYPDLRRCTCSERAVQQYQRKLSGPFFDRIDIAVKVGAISEYEWQGEVGGRDSGKMKEKVEAAIKRQRKRYEKEEILFNSQLSEKQVRKYCLVDEEADWVLKMTAKRRGWSMRTYFRSLKVARTIADLEGETTIKKIHMIEAISYHSHFGEKEDRR